MKELKGIREKEMWGVFDDSGYLLFSTISDTRENAKAKIVIIYYSMARRNWNDYASNGYTTDKILVDIKII